MDYVLTLNTNLNLFFVPTFLFRGNVSAFDSAETFELYVLREDLTVNPIPERADAMRTQAEEGGGLCAIGIPIFTDTDGFLNATVDSVTPSAQCNITVCRSGGCHACNTTEGENICSFCSTSADCDGLENVLEYRYCDCDAVVTVNDNDEFVLYTGEITIFIFDKTFNDMFHSETITMILYLLSFVQRDGCG